MANFQFTIKYTPGKANRDADGLSHMPFDIEEYMHAYSHKLLPDVMTSLSHFVSPFRINGVNCHPGMILTLVDRGIFMLSC